MRSRTSFRFSKKDLVNRCNYNIIMNELRFEWDLEKARENLLKHDVSSEEE